MTSEVGTVFVAVPAVNERLLVRLICKICPVGIVIITGDQPAGVVAVVHAQERGFANYFFTATTAAQSAALHTEGLRGWDLERVVRMDTGVVTKLFAALAAALSVPFLGAVPTAHAGGYCELGNLLIPQEVHHVGTYRDATCAAVADIVTISQKSDCIPAVTNYVVSRGYDPYVAKDIALHNC